MATPPSPDYRSRITIDPAQRGGKPCVRSLRISVYEVLEYLASGMCEDQILADFPDLERADLQACLAFAADRERKFTSVPPRQAVRLLQDQNLAPRLVVKLADIFPGSVHVRHLDMARAVDDAVWKYAIAHDLAAVEAFADDPQLAFIALG